MEWMLDSLRSGPSHSLTFRTFSSEDIKRLSVVKIVSPETFTVLGHPKPGGLYDEAMGPIEQLGVCSTCGFKKVSCPGHMGHIELPLLIINPLFHKVIESFLKMSCVRCYKILIPDFCKYLLIGQLKLLDKGYLAEALELSQRFSYLDVSLVDLSSVLLFRTSIDQFVDEVLSKDSGMIREVRGEAELRNSFIKTAKSRVFKNNFCPNCRRPWKVISCIQNKLMINMAKLNGKMASTVVFLLPTQCETLLKKIWENEAEFMKALVPMLGNSSEAEPIDSLFMKAIAVTANNARPVQFVDKRMIEHPISIIYTAILYDCLDVKTIILVMNNKEGESGLSDMRRDLVKSLRGENYSEKLQHAWQKLQTDVDTLLDIDMKRVRFPKGLGIKQIIEKKQGCIRMNMMGKRVNFAARTVITPDPNLNINEIGIPKIFAKRLTFPVPVTPWNVVELRKIVNNGPESYPGANYVDYEDGSRVRLNEKDSVQRQSIANTLLTPGYSKSGQKGVKVVHRHLRNGDMVLLNRQPTLHRPSIMAHKVRVLEGEKTFRMHYANCKSYNADFDGDEMNVHFPQHQAARSEALFLANVSTQYLVPKDGTPLSGLIQDYMVSGVRLSVRGKIFNRHDYMQLVYQSLSYVDGDIKTLKPCILKPVECWSGKQIISTIVINLIPKGAAPINLISKSKISQKAWGYGRTRSWEAGGTPFKKDITMSEAEVIIRSGELLCGVLDKMHYGATPYSLVHCMYELYGGDVSSALLSSFSRLFTAFLQMEGFSLGVEDILVSKKADKKRTKLIEKVRNIGNDIVSTLVDAAPSDEIKLKKEISEMYNKDPLFKNVLDHKYKTNLDTFTNKINQACMPNGLLKPFPDNSLQLMVQSGAKGSTVNTMQISCLLGQIELEGKRPPLMISGKALPSFPQYDTSPRAGGFVDGRFMTGIKPQEFFFHCMAGREGLIDTAVKTSRSGYLQRCLVKHLEGVSVQYDRTVRDADGSVIQFLYGEDGLEVTKSQFLKSEQLPFLVDNMSAVRNTEILESYKANNCDFKAVKTYRKKINRWHSSGGRKARSTPFLKFCEYMKESIEGPNSKKINPTTGRAFQSDKLCGMWYELTEEEKLKYECSAALTPDTMVSKLSPDKYYGSITEKLEDLIDHYLATNRKEVEERSFRRVMTDKFLGALCPPGEPVGMLAAQSVGEPSTQMTLNTFHFAGRGEMNVTLGIPRLIEILMVASKNIKTPSMAIPFVQHDISDKFDKKADRLRRHLTKVTLADVLEYIEVSEKIEVRPRRLQIYALKMQFLPHEAYKESTKVTPKQILRYVESKFLKLLVSFMTAKKNRKAFEISVSKVVQEKVDADIDGEEGGNSKKENRKRGGVLDEADNEDKDEESDDSDNEGADAAKRRSRHENDQGYSDEEDENKVEEEGGGDPTEEEWNVDEPEAEETKEEKPDVKLLDQQMAEVRAELEKRKAKVTAQESIKDYKFDTERYEWCEVTVGLSIAHDQIELSSRLKELVAKCVIHQVPGVNRAFIQTNPTGEKVLRTDGINVDEIYTYDNLLELNKLYMNDVHVMAAMYGIDAAASVIVKEVKDVFKVYGITVDPRHLTLIADYMTFDGVYRPLSRKSMEGGASPLQGMSFESSLTVLKNAVLQSRTDTLTNPSSRVMMGMPIKAGTGAFSLFYKIQQLT